MSFSTVKKLALCSTAIIFTALTAPVLEAESLLLTNAKLHTMSDKGTLDGADIYIVDGMIKSIGNDLDISDADQTLDLTGKVVTPGIFAVANQIGLVEIDALDQTADMRTEDEDATASFNMHQVFNSKSTLIPHNRSYGVTRTLIAPYLSTSVFAGQGAIMSLNGEYDALIRKDVAMFAAYGERGSGLAGGSRASALKQLQTAFDEAKEFKANQEAILVGEYRELNNSFDDLKALQAVVNSEIPLVIFVNRASDIQTLLAFAKHNKIRLVLAGAAEAWRVADDIAAAKVPVMIDPIDNIPGSFESMGKTIENAAKLSKAGVEVIFLGQSFQATHNAHMVRQSAGNAVAYGMPYDKALSAMTVTPARVFGGSSNYGKLIAGYKAELVVWDGDPLEVTTSTDYVAIDGKLYDIASRALRLRDRYKDIKNVKKAVYTK